jgi:hypothetical protein
MRRCHNREQAPPGLIRLGTLIWLMLLVGGVYLGVKFAPPYWDYLSMLDPVKEAAMAAAVPGREEQARAELIARAKKLGLILDEESVAIVRSPGGVRVRAEWNAPVVLPRYRHILHFRVESQYATP